MNLDNGIWVVTSRRRGLLVSTLGVSLAMGLIDTLLIGRSALSGLLFGSSTHFFTVMSAETGIGVEKLLLLDYFLFLPWPVTNLSRVDYFFETGYPRELQPDKVPMFILFHSLYFLFGALLAVALSGEEKRPAEGELPFTLKDHPPPWVLYTLVTLVVHLVLIGAATTYYTGPGGPVWLYPSPFWLIPFGVGIGVLSFVAQAIYTGLRYVFGFK